MLTLRKGVPYLTAIGVLDDSVIVAVTAIVVTVDIAITVNVVTIADHVKESERLEITFGV